MNLEISIRLFLIVLIVLLSPILELKLRHDLTSLDVVEISVTVDRYALDVNVERAEDVLTHKRLLHLAEDPANRPVFEVRMVQVFFHFLVSIMKS